MGPDYEKLEEICSIYGKANYEKGERIKELEEENKELKEENRNLKAELDKLKSTYVYDAKQVRDVC